MQGQLNMAGWIEQANGNPIYFLRVIRVARALALRFQGRE